MPGVMPEQQKISMQLLVWEKRPREAQEFLQKTGQHWKARVSPSFREPTEGTDKHQAPAGQALFHSNVRSLKLPFSLTPSVTHSLTHSSTLSCFSCFPFSVSERQQALLVDVEQNSRTHEAGTVF